MISKLERKTLFTPNFDDSFTVLLNSHDWSCTGNRRWIKFTSVFSFSSINCCPHWPPTSTINKADPSITFKAIAEKWQLYLPHKNSTLILLLQNIKHELGLYCSISYGYQNNHFTSRERFMLPQKENQLILFKTWLSFAKSQEINIDYLNLRSCTIVVDDVKGNFLKEFKLVSKYDLSF